MKAIFTTDTYQLHSEVLGSDTVIEPQMTITLVESVPGAMNCCTYSSNWTFA